MKGTQAMHFDKREYNRLARTYWMSLALLAINATVAGVILLRSIMVGGFGDLMLFSSFGPSVIFYVTLVTAIGSLTVVLSTLPRFDQLHKILDPIERLMKAFEVCDISKSAETLFKDFTGHVISVRQRTSGGYTVVIQTPHGTIQRTLVVQRYRIDYGIEVGEELSVTELGYINGLVKFFEGQIAGEKVLSALDYDQMLRIDTSPVEFGHHAEM